MSLTMMIASLVDAVTARVLRILELLVRPACFSNVANDPHGVPLAAALDRRRGNLHGEFLSISPGGYHFYSLIFSRALRKLAKLSWWKA